MRRRGSSHVRSESAIGAAVSSGGGAGPWGGGGGGRDSRMRRVSDVARVAARREVGRRG